MGLCPFHDDRNPSLSIDPVKNEWHCFGCDRKGDVIEWVKCAEGVSFHRALELLKRDYVPSAGPVVKVATVPKLPPLIDPTADDKKLLGVVVDYYNRTLQDSPEAKRYLLKRGLQSGEIIDRFKLGYANRTLSLHLPASNRLAGDAQRARLKALGVIRNQTPGHEHFNGSLVVPVFNLAGDVVEMYGRKIVPNLRTGTDYHTYLPGPHRGVWNEEALIASKDIMEAVLDFIPEEHRVSYTAMTSQALFYMGQKNLKHKILAIAEQQGAEAASYPLKLLQSEGKLNIASTGKDPVSGKHVTHEYEVEGPVMIFLTTTATDVDEELMNRCLVLAVNEDREQTRAIHRKQREAQTLDGLKARMRQDKIVRLHRNAQRLLRPVQVVIEHLKDHSFPDAMTRTRRDHMKFLTLIQAITLLYQHQREVKVSDEDGSKLEYIEATEADVKLAWELASHVLMRSLDDVQTQTRRLLLLIDKLVTSECERLEIERLDYRFTRATVRQFSGWSDSQLKKHLHRLEELEYLALHRGAPGQSFVYALNFEMDESGRPVLPGLSYGAKRTRPEEPGSPRTGLGPWGGPDRSGSAEGVSGVEGQRSGSSLGQIWGVSGGGVSEPSPVSMRAQGGFTAKNGKHIDKGAGANGSAQASVVVVPKPNGHALAEHMGAD
jgi:hypothetical protein